MRWADIDLHAATWRTPPIGPRTVVTVALATETVMVFRKRLTIRSASPWVLLRCAAGHLTELRKTSVQTIKVSASTVSWSTTCYER
jgi:integrase